MARLRDADAQKRRESNRSPDFSEALARGLRVIGAFDAQRPQLTLSEVARAIDLPRATARRAIVTLQELGYLASDGRLFRLTPKVLELATTYLSSNLVSTLLQPRCEHIAQLIGEACSVAVLEGDDVVMIAHASPRRFMSVGVGVGLRLPAHCSSLGRVLLAALPPAELDGFLARTALLPATAHTLTDKAVLRARLEEVRRQGYALVDQEAELGFRSIAVPVRRYDGHVVAAINVGARVEAASVQSLLEGYLPLLRGEAEVLSKQTV